MSRFCGRPLWTTPNKIKTLLQARREHHAVRGVELTRHAYSSCKVYWGKTILVSGSSHGPLAFFKPSTRHRLEQRLVMNGC